MRVVLLLADRVFENGRYMEAFVYYLQAAKLKKHSKNQLIIDRIFISLEKYSAETDPSGSIA